MKLIPHCRRVKIRIESNGRSCGTLDALKANFNIEDIIPLVEDGRLRRWLEDLDEDDTLTLARSLSRIPHYGSLTQKGKKVLIAFFPDYFNEKANVIDSILYLQNKIKDHKRLLHLIAFFKAEFTKKKLLDNWDYLVAYYGDDFEKIVSLFGESDKEINKKWNAYNYKRKSQEKPQERPQEKPQARPQERPQVKPHVKPQAPPQGKPQDVYSWREKLLQSPAGKEYPTTAKKLGECLSGNNIQKIAEPALRSFYEVVNYLNIVMGSSNSAFLRLEDYRLMLKRLHDTEHANDPLELERKFISDLIEWHWHGHFLQNNLAYKKAVQLSKKQTVPINIRGRIDFVLNDQTPFESMTLWKQILYVTVNIFNKNLYPDWK